MKILKDEKVSPIYLDSHDTLNVTYTDIYGRRTLATCSPSGYMEIDRILITEHEELNGMENAISITMGKNKRNTNESA